MDWYTADTHAGHLNILRYCARPFKTLAEHDRALVHLWNSVVGPRDTVFHLGDVAFGPASLLAPLRKRLNGRIVLIRGNHDRSRDVMLEAGFDEVYESLDIPHGEYMLHLTHKPQYLQHLWDEKDLNFHGHVHNEWNRINYHWINVGVDRRNFRPVSADELVADRVEIRHYLKRQPTPSGLSR